MSHMAQFFLAHATLQPPFDKLGVRHVRGHPLLQRFCRFPHGMSPALLSTDLEYLSYDGACAVHREPPRREAKPMAFSIRSSVGPVVALLFATGLACGSSDVSPGSDENDGGAGTGNPTGTGGAGASGVGGSSTGTGGSAGSNSGAGGSSGVAGEQDASAIIPPPDAGSQRDATSVPDATSSGNCSAAIALADCDARPACHPVFIDQMVCGCAALGCCIHYQRCADGKKATCTAPAGLACEAPQPRCEGPYVVGYTTSCYEGCVRATDCGT
jgi:hypothetical protein